MGAGLEVAILGPLQVDVVGRRLTLGGARQRAVLASLVIRSGGVVPAAMVIGDVWGLDAPIGALHSLQQHLSELRKLLAAPDLLRTHEGGYQLVVGALDADEFEDLVRAGTDAATAGRHDEALEHRERALGRWRGSVLVDVPESPAIRSVATRLDEMRSAVEEDRIESLLSLGRPRDAVALLEPLVQEHPYRERLRGQQMLALYRSGRQSDALGAFSRARAALVDGLGIEPSPALRELEQLILRQSDRLEPDRGSSTPGGVAETFRPDGQPLARLELPDGQVVVLTDGTVALGRDPGVDVRLADSRVSRRHAEIVTMGAESMLVDVGSTNGTFVNGEPVGRAVLGDGDVVSLGGVVVRFVDDR